MAVMFTADEHPADLDKADCLEEAAHALAECYRALAETTTAPAEARAV